MIIVFLINLIYLKKFLIYGNSLQTLTISLIYLIRIENLKMNSNLHSMTSYLNSFENIFLLIKLTSNLEYLNVDSYQPDENQNQISINKTIFFKINLFIIESYEFVY